MKRILGVAIFMIMIIGIMSPLTMAQPQTNETATVPTYVDVYTFPRNPIGAYWDTGLDGDIITVYAEIENADWVDIKTGFCNHYTCTIGEPWVPMTNVGGNYNIFEISHSGKEISTLFLKIFDLLGLDFDKPKQNPLEMSDMVQMILYLKDNPGGKIKNHFRTDLKLSSITINRNLDMMVKYELASLLEENKVAQLEQKPQ